MSNALQTPALLAAIAAAIETAWSITNISIGKPRTLQPLPNAEIYWGKVGVSFDGLLATATNTNQHNPFAIVARWPFPTDSTQNVELLKITRANELIAALQTGPVFANIGALPLVEEIDPDELDPENEATYELVCTFTVNTQASHH